MEEKLKLNSKLFLIGATGYSVLEVAWRGFTHWTMAVTGGICFTAIYYLNEKYSQKPLWKRCAMGASVITGIEFLVGCIVNLAFHWNVWNYSAMHFNILGQVCLLYSVLWFLLSIPLFWLSGKLKESFSRVRQAG